MTRRELLRASASLLVFSLHAACQPSLAGSFNPRPRPTTTGGAQETSPPLLPGATASSPATPTPTTAFSGNRLELPLEVAITPTSRFYINTYSDVVPTFDPRSWRLNITGLVEQPHSLTLAELERMPTVEAMRTLECIGNPTGGPLIGNAWWRAVPLRQVLATVRVRAEAKFVRMYGDDGYFTCVPLDLALSENALLALEMNGEPLTPEHGRPIRLLLPGVYGQKQPKWLSRLELSAQYEKGTWEQKGWSDTAWIRPKARIDRPADYQPIISKAGQVFTIAGIAFTGPSGVAKVEVSTDDGRLWDAAILTRAQGANPELVWTRWGYQWEVPGVGEYSLQARVTDRAGNGQGEATSQWLDNAFPEGSHAIHRVIVEVLGSTMTP